MTDAPHQTARRRRAVPRIAASIGLAAALGISAGIATATTPAPDGPATDPAPPPSQWPDSPAITARIDGAAHAVRLFGPDRQQTALALALALRGSGGYPFDSPDRSSHGASTLAAADGWWGLGRCPRAIIVVAGDTPADALTASSLSDPTDLSTEPYLQRTAAADPLFDPIGGFARVDTDAAPILVTRSTRQGATALSPAARRAAQDLRNGGCSTARQAIIVGGTGAVPEEVDDELVSLGYDEVFRVAGIDRYATAAAVARSLGTAPPPPGVTSCGDPVVNDGAARMTFHANSVVEHRPSADECEVLGRAVVLADGITGADALAAGWWTSFWQVPVLLHDSGASLRPATADALETMQVDHLIVLGGTARIPVEAVEQAEAITGARSIRVAGADRYETSVEMARRFGGWWPTGRGAEFAGSMVCVAASSGDGPTARGWPDALAAGPWCGAANLAASDVIAPTRALTPVAGRSPTTSSETPDPDAPGNPLPPDETDDVDLTDEADEADEAEGPEAEPIGGIRGIRRHDAVPLLLVRADSSSLPASVESLLRQAFDPADAWCTSVASPAGCLEPGFAVVVGGPAAVAESVLTQLSQLVSGSSSLETGTITPVWADPFWTTLDLAPVFGQSGAGPTRVCAGRGDYERARWLTVYGDSDAARPLGAADVMLDGRYVTDADGTERTQGTGAPVCVRVSTGSRTEVLTRAVGLAGRASPALVLPVGADRRMGLVDPLTAEAPETASGVDSDLDDSGGGTTIRSYTVTTPDPAVTVEGAGTNSTVSSATITITLVRGTDTPTSQGPDVFTATWTITTPLGTVTGAADGEAILVGDTWELAGSTTFTGGSWALPAGQGGFRASLATNTPGDPSDDALTWQLDAIAP